MTTDTLTTETTPDTSTASTFTVRADDFGRILHNAWLATDTTRTLPVLGAVRLELDGRTLQAIATDRYRLHSDTATVEHVGAAAPAAVLLDRADVASVVKLVKNAGAVTVTLSAGTVAVRTTSTTSTFATIEGTFPSWRALMPEHSTDDGPGAPFAFNPLYAADFAKVLVPGSRGTNAKANVMRLQSSSATKPFRVEIGDTFVGLLMPVRMPEQSK